MEEGGVTAQPGITPVSVASSPSTPPTVTITEGGDKSHVVKLLIPISLILLVLIVASVSIYVFLKNDLVVLEERNLIAGAEIPLEDGEPVELQLLQDGGSLRLTASEGEGSATITSATGESEVVPIGEDYSLDLDEDGVADVVITIIQDANGKISFTFKRVTPLPSSDGTRQGESGGEVTSASESSTSSSDNRFPTPTPNTNDDNDDTPQNTPPVVQADPACTALQCAIDKKCGYLPGNTDTLSCVFKQCSDYSGTVCNPDEYCSGSAILSDVSGNNVQGEGCCTGGPCLSRQEKCALKEHEYCGSGYTCEGSTFTYKDVSQASFVCCSGTCVQEAAVYECTDGIDNDGDGGIDMLEEIQNYEEEWIAAWAQECPVACNAINKISAPGEAYGDICSSGYTQSAEVSNFFGLETENDYLDLYQGGCGQGALCSQMPYGLGDNIQMGLYCFPSGTTPGPEDFVDMHLTAACHCVTKTECNDGIDNDGDGNVDEGDAGCVSPGDTSEREHDLECVTESNTEEGGYGPLEGGDEEYSSEELEY